MSRGQEDFVKLPDFSAGLYESLTRTTAMDRQYKEIAQDLVSGLARGRLLDIGTGPGKLLFEVHRLNPEIELYGLDISAAMCSRAGKNLAGIPVDLQCSDIRRTRYAENHFDLITCRGSFYLWDEPAACLAEVFRILKPGRTAFLFEAYADVDKKRVRDALKQNPQGESLLRNLLTPYFMMRNLRFAYSIAEVEAIIQQTHFANSYRLERISLAGLPIWLRIQLRKPSEIQTTAV